MNGSGGLLAIPATCSVCQGQSCSDRCTYCLLSQLRQVYTLLAVPAQTGVHTACCPSSDRCTHCLLSQLRQVYTLLAVPAQTGVHTACVYQGQNCSDRCTHCLLSQLRQVYKLLAVPAQTGVHTACCPSSDRCTHCLLSQLRQVYTLLAVPAQTGVHTACCPSSDRCTHCLLSQLRQVYTLLAVPAQTGVHTACCPSSDRCTHCLLSQLRQVYTLLAVPAQTGVHTACCPSSDRCTHCLLSQLRQVYILLAVPATCSVYQGQSCSDRCTHCHAGMRSDFLSLPVTVYWHWADQSHCWPDRYWNTSLQVTGMSRSGKGSRGGRKDLNPGLPLSKQTFYHQVTISFSLSSRWHYSTWKGPYALCLISQQSPQGYPRNSANICLVEHRSFLTSEDGKLAASFLHSSFLQAISAVMLWPVHVQKVPQASEQLCPSKLQTRCDMCCACQSICPLIPTDSRSPCQLNQPDLSECGLVQTLFFLSIFASLLLSVCSFCFPFLSVLMGIISCIFIMPVVIVVVFIFGKVSLFETLLACLLLSVVSLKMLSLFLSLFWLSAWQNNLCLLQTITGFKGPFNGILSVMHKSLFLCAVCCCFTWTLCWTCGSVTVKFCFLCYFSPWEFCWLPLVYIWEKKCLDPFIKCSLCLSFKICFCIYKTFL